MSETVNNSSSQSSVGPSPESIGRGVAAGLQAIHSSASAGSPSKAPVRTVADLYNTARQQSVTEVASRRCEGTPLRVRLFAESVEVDAATWDTAYINALPDAAFAAIEDGGSKDGEGKTMPRSLRHLPHHNKNVKSPTEQSSVDIPHLRNAVARLKKTNIPAGLKARAKSHLQMHVRAAIKDGKMKDSDLAARNLEILIGLAEDLAAISTTAADDGGTTPDFWAQQREMCGLSEIHDNAMYLVMTLTHADQVMNNYNRDFIPLDEAQAAAPTLVGQPIDMADTMDCHERERLWGSNGIRGYIYAQRMVGTAQQIGVCLWCTDFPDLAAKVLEFQASLGGSFDLFAYDYSYEPDETAQPPNPQDSPEQPANYPIARTTIRYGTEPGADDQTPQKRVLKKITYLGGAILTKARAADPNTEISDITYAGKSADELMQERNCYMSQTANEGAAPATAANQPVNQNPPAAAPPATAPPPTPGAQEPITLIAALNSAQREAADLRTDRDRLAREVQVRDEQLRLAQANLDTEKTLKRQAEAERDAAKAESDAIKAQQANAERVGQRLTLLDTLPGKHGLQNVPVFETEELRTQAASDIRDMDDTAFNAYCLEREIDVLKRGTAAVAAANGTRPAAAAAAAQAGAAPPSPTAAVTAAGEGAGAAPFNPVDFGKSLSSKVRQGATTN